MNGNNIKSVKISETYSKGIHPNRKLKIGDTDSYRFGEIVIFYFYFSVQSLSGFEKIFMLIINQLDSRKKTNPDSGLQLLDNQHEFFILTGFDKVLKLLASFSNPKGIHSDNLTKTAHNMQIISSLKALSSFAILKLLIISVKTSEKKQGVYNSLIFSTLFFTCQVCQVSGNFRA